MRKLKLQELNRISIAEFKETEKTPVVIVLDNVRSGLNVGSAFRTADAFAIEKIYLCGITAQPPHREILKTAIGATASINWEHIDQTKAIPFGSKMALVFGNEVNGVSQEIMGQINECIEVPQFGTKHSLNISVCIGVVIWEIFRKWKYV